MDNQQKTLELGTKPVGRLLTQYALPAIIAMVASSLYNITDSIFIGQGVGALAISGLAVTFPFMNLSAALGAAVGIGSSTCISINLGQKNYTMAQRIFGQSITLNIITGVAFAAVSLLFLDPILRFFGASDATLPYAREYMVVILLGNALTHLFFGSNALLRAAGKPRHAMYATMLSVLMNIILSPLFIWPMHMGIQGAALATIISQIVAVMWQCRLFADKAEVIHLARGIYGLQTGIVKRIFAIGMSPFAMNTCACVVVIFINNSLAKHGGDLAVGAYGIVMRISFVFVMVNMGINQGMLPIAGYNYGAQRFDRLIKVLTYAMVAATMVAVAGFAVAETMPRQCARLFTTDETLVAMAAKGMRIAMAAFPLVGYQMVVTNFFQGIGKAKISIFLSLSRQMLFLLPLIVVLPPLMGIDGVWMALPAADAISALVAGYMMVRYMRKFKKQHKMMYDGKE